MQEVCQMLCTTSFNPHNNSKRSLILTQAEQSAWIYSEPIRPTWANGLPTCSLILTCFSIRFVGSTFKWLQIPNKQVKINKNIQKPQSRLTERGFPEFPEYLLLLHSRWPVFQLPLHALFWSWLCQPVAVSPLIGLSFPSVQCEGWTNRSLRSFPTRIFQGSQAQMAPQAGSLTYVRTL